MEAASIAAPAASLLRIITNRQPVEGMLKALAAVLSPASKTSADSAHGVNQMSRMMLHIDTIRRSGIEFSDLSESAIEALHSSANIKNDPDGFNSQSALGHIQTLTGSGCQSWQDVTKYLAGKSLPLLKDLENGAFTSLVKSSGTDGGLSAAIKHLSKEFEETLGKDFESFQPAFESASCTLEYQWKKALADIIHLDQKTFLDKSSTHGLSLETKKKADYSATPEALRKQIDVEPLFPSHHKQGFFFRITSKKGEHLTFMDICRLSKQLTPDAKPPVQWPRQGGKDGLIISTADRKLAVFLSSCHPPSPMAGTHHIPFQFNARP